MNWTDTAIILSTRRHGENSAVVRVFSKDHGVYAGVLRAANSKAQRGVAQVSNIVSATWNARLAEQLGTFKFELLVPSAAHFMQDGLRLTALISACTIIESALPERHPYPKLYRQLLTFLDALEHNENWLYAYVELELAILAESGFGLDLSRCAATDRTDDLIYVSPKSGRAVCREAGEPYKDRLLELPGFLVDCHPRLEQGSQDTANDIAHDSRSPHEAGVTKDIHAGMRLTGHFLSAWLLEPHRKTLPAARGRLMDLLAPAAEMALQTEVS